MGQKHNAATSVAGERFRSEKGDVLLRGVGMLRYFFPPDASVQWQPDGLVIHTNNWFVGARFLGAPPISLIWLLTGKAAGTCLVLSWRVVLGDF